MAITTLEGETPAWREFLSTNPAHAVHTPQWKRFVQSVFAGIDTRYYAEQNGEKISAILPFVRINHPLGKKSISCAFVEYGGAAGNPSVEFFREAVAKERFFAKRVEIRQPHDDNRLEAFMRHDAPYLWGRTALGTEKTVWESLDKYARKAVRRAERDGVSVRELAGRDVEALYELYLSGMQAFGSPPMGRRFFDAFFSELVQKNLARGFGAFVNGKLAAILLGYTFQNRIHVIVNVSDENKRALFVNDAVHWAFMQWGCQNGFTVFDWGRVREESGQYQFKKKWATRFEKLHHYYALPASASIPNADPAKGINPFLASAFRLVPKPVARRVGPWLREGLGI